MRTKLLWTYLFYLFYPKFQTLSGKLSWSHICELVAIDDELERSFYEKECINEHWSLRALRRQIDSGLFMRLALSKDKEGVLSLAHEGIKTTDLQRPEDVVRDTYTLEFLGHSKDDLMVEYATYGMDTNLFVSKYELYLPNKDDLCRMVSRVLS